MAVTNVFVKKTGATDALYTATASDLAIFGAAGGGENVLISATASVWPAGIVIDQNIEKVTFDGAYTDFTFARAGNTDVLVYKGATLVATIRPQTDDDTGGSGTAIAFTQGLLKETTLNITAAGTIKMGGASGAFSQALQTTAAAYVADSAAPVVLANTDVAHPGAIARANTIVIGYSDDSLLDAVNGPLVGAFTVVLDGSTPSKINSAVVDGSAKTVTLTLATAITSAQTVSVSYADPTANDDANAIQDVNGNDARSVGYFTENQTASLSYGRTTFAESAANSGAITETSTITLTHDTFAGAVGASLGTVTNMSTGLTGTLVKASATTATLGFSGSATGHANANDVNNLTVAFGAGAFTLNDAARVEGSTRSDLKLDFRDPGTISYNATKLVEATANDGGIAGPLTVTLANGTFSGVNGAALGTVTHVPAGLTASLVRASDTTATLTLTGKATAHANADDIANLTVAFGNADFTGGNAAAVVGATRSDLAVDFNDPIPTSFTFTGLAGGNFSDLAAFDFSTGPKTLYWNVTAANLANGGVDMRAIGFGIDDRIVVAWAGGANPDPYSDTSHTNKSGVTAGNTFSTPVKYWSYDSVWFKQSELGLGNNPTYPYDTYTFYNSIAPVLQFYSQIDNSTQFLVEFGNMPSFYHPTAAGDYQYQYVAPGASEASIIVPNYEAGGNFISFI